MTLTKDMTVSFDNKAKLYMYLYIKNKFVRYLFLYLYYDCDN